MEEINNLWLRYNDYANKLSAALGRTNNIVGEYAEYLAHRHYGGRLLRASESSADIEADDGTKYQVKARKIKGTTATQLNVIRSWNFDYLVVILFEADGKIFKALEVPVAVAKKYGADNQHQNGKVITTSRKFLLDPQSKDITLSIIGLSQ
ncbi:DUF6998 domain-containing protein [Pseudomonas paeninsulae]|uniref:DUF6998 domain-containing protein n=1 Tax=Pseudomonas paeninsulae TaxID=3110772 RepID=UPI002D766107|nr:hypothetical protein [Pseudomonas sp. IT1137]